MLKAADIYGQCFVSYIQTVAAVASLETEFLKDNYEYLNCNSLVQFVHKCFMNYLHPGMTTKNTSRGTAKKNSEQNKFMIGLK